MFDLDEEEEETKRLAEEHNRLIAENKTETYDNPWDDGSNQYIVVRSNRTGRLYTERCTGLSLGYIQCVGAGLLPKVLERTAYTLVKLHGDECFGTYAECQSYVENHGPHGSRPGLLY